MTTINTLMNHNQPFYYRLRLAYQGTNYKGWQIQPDHKTVQGELNKALMVLSAGESVHTMASGRTDTGVHALDQHVRVIFPKMMEPLAFVRSLNALLPDDIRALSCTYVPDGHFHPLSEVKVKEYHYYFSNSMNGDENLFLSSLISQKKEKLDFELMQKACELFVGEHDFANFYCKGSDVPHTRRRIFSCRLESLEFPQGTPFAASVFAFQVCGEGFLKQMVRLMVAALWAVGESKISLQDLQDSLDLKRMGHLSKVAPAHGLYMMGTRLESAKEQEIEVDFFSSES